MSGGQIAALLCAIVLLLPGGCFLVFGIGFAGERQSGLSELGLVMLLVAAAILGLAGFLFWVAMRRRHPPAAGGDSAA